MFDSKNFTILIVDDNPKNLQVLGSTLKDEGYLVEFATNGAQAIEWLKERLFDLILLDIMMPEMDGFEACSIIRQDSKFDDMPIIFLTAKTDKESILKGFDLGAQDYISKPFDSRELLARSKTQLELKDSKEKLKSVNQWLEEKVNERTKQLNEANIKLTKAHEELLLLDKAKAEFLNIISHEIRTPLNGITTPVQLLKSEIDNHDHKELLNILDSSVIRLEKFSSTALLITGLLTKRHRLNKERISIEKLIESSSKELEQDLKSKQITVIKEGIEDSDFVIGDLKLLDICLYNILDNAVKYSDHGGQIQILLQRGENELSCHVIDQGKGFPQDVLDHPFSFFEPGEQHIDQNAGLGLALANLIMDAHEANIEISNNKQKGATVILTFKERNHGE